MNVRCGRTVCDIHEEHEAILVGEIDDWNRYNFIRISGCFGRQEWSGMRAEQMLAVIDDHMDKPHTRKAYRKLRMARKLVKDGALESNRYLKNKFPKLNSQISPAEVPSQALVDWLNTNDIPTPVVRLAEWERALLIQDEITWDQEEDQPF
jgi:hypothetical protein